MPAMPRNSLLPTLSATAEALLPSASVACTSTPRASRSLAKSLCPSRAHMCRGVEPVPASCACMSAPASSSSSALSMQPYRMATCSGVWPPNWCSSRTFTSAPAAHRKYSMRTSFAAAAMCVARVLRGGACGPSKSVRGWRRSDTRNAPRTHSHLTRHTTRLLPANALPRPGFLPSRLTGTCGSALQWHFLQGCGRWPGRLAAMQPWRWLRYGSAQDRAGPRANTISTEAISFAGSVRLALCAFHAVGVAL